LGCWRLTALAGILIALNCVLSLSAVPHIAHLANAQQHTFMWLLQQHYIFHYQITRNMINNNSNSEHSDASPSVSDMSPEYPCTLK
jgi:hypothetical protein